MASVIKPVSPNESAILNDVKFTGEQVATILGVLRQSVRDDRSNREDSFNTFPDASREFLPPIAQNTVDQQLCGSSVYPIAYSPDVEQETASDQTDYLASIPLNTDDDKSLYELIAGFQGDLAEIVQVMTSHSALSSTDIHQPPTQILEHSTEPPPRPIRPLPTRISSHTVAPSPVRYEDLFQVDQGHRLPAVDQDQIQLFQQMPSYVMPYATTSRSTAHTSFTTMPSKKRPLSDSSESSERCVRARKVEQSGTVVCQWVDQDSALACGEFIKMNITSVNNHLRMSHGVYGVSKSGQTVSCPWSGCKKAVQQRSLSRHIVNLHSKDVVFFDREEGSSGSSQTSPANWSSEESNFGDFEWATLPY